MFAKRCDGLIWNSAQNGLVDNAVEHERSEGSKLREESTWIGPCVGDGGLQAQAFFVDSGLYE